MRCATGLGGARDTLFELTPWRHVMRHGHSAEMDEAVRMRCLDAFSLSTKLGVSETTLAYGAQKPAPQRERQKV